MQTHCVLFGVGTELLNAASTEIRVLSFSQLYYLFLWDQIPRRCQTSGSQCAPRGSKDTFLRCHLPVVYYLALKRYINR